MLKIYSWFNLVTNKHNISKSVQELILENKTYYITQLGYSYWNDDSKNFDNFINNNIIFSEKNIGNFPTEKENSLIEANEQFLLMFCKNKTGQWESIYVIRFNFRNTKNKDVFTSYQQLMIYPNIEKEKKNK